MFKHLVCTLLLIGCLTACKKEIDFEYHEVESFVVIEGQVTNEGTEVLITRSRSVTDSVKGRCLPGATVRITAMGVDETIAYDAAAQCYRSVFKGAVGETYTLTVDFEGHQYTGTSTMPPPAPILSAEFLWFSMLNERMVVYELWATDSRPTERNYYWYRMDRKSSHPHFLDKVTTEPYAWSVFDNRGNPPGLLYRDIFCMSERTAQEDEEDNWKRILYDGDVITFRLMAIDRPTYEYLTSLRAGQSGGANPKTNLTGGCAGYFTAASVTRTAPVVFSYKDVKQEASFQATENQK